MHLPWHFPFYISGCFPVHVTAVQGADFIRICFEKCSTALYNGPALFLSESAKPLKNAKDRALPVKTNWRASIFLWHHQLQSPVDLTNTKESTSLIPTHRLTPMLGNLPVGSDKPCYHGFRCGCPQLAMLTGGYCLYLDRQERCLRSSRVSDSLKQQRQWVCMTSLNCCRNKLLGQGRETTLMRTAIY